MFFSSYLPCWGIVLASIVVSIVLYKLGHKFLSRKILHIFAISACSLAAQITTAQTYYFFVIQLIVASAILWFVVLFGVFKTENRKSWGIAYFPTVLSLLVLLFPTRLGEIGLSFMVLAWSDGLSAIVGRGLERFMPDWNRLKWGSDPKTVLGSIVFCLTTFICIWFSDGVNFNQGSNGFKVSLIFFISISAALVELISSKGRDNCWVPLWVFFAFPIANSWNTIYELGYIALTLGLIFLFITIRMKWLHPSGALFALILGILIYAQGLTLLPVIVFFVLGSLASKVAIKTNSDNKHSKPRDAFQVIANGGLVGAMTLLIGVFPDYKQVFNNLIYISMAVALADTLSSELGMFFKGKTWSVTTLKPIPAGVSGGVSFYGSLFGLLGAVIVGILSWMEVSDNPNFIIDLIIWGFIGMLLDSVLGDLFQHRYIKNDRISDTGYLRQVGGFRFLNNDQVNLLSNGLVVLAYFLFY